MSNVTFRDNTAQECEEARCQESQDREEECRMVMVEVCGEVTRQMEAKEDCWTLHRMDCESHWVGEGENRVGYNEHN